jgi:hypothetical protein
MKIVREGEDIMEPSQSRHTPGPWNVEYDGPSLPIITSHTLWFEIVALVRTNETDAHLIAAAPELLAALKEWAALTREESFDLLERTHAAIAKAEGK